MIRPPKSNVGRAGLALYEWIGIAAIVIAVAALIGPPAYRVWQEFNEVVEFKEEMETLGRPRAIFGGCPCSEAAR